MSIGTLIIVTITLKNSGEKLTFGFESRASLKAELELVPEHDRTRIQDDFGAKATIENSEIAAFVVTEVEKRNELDNALGVSALRRENEFQQKVQADPTLKFLVGQPNPLFNKK